MVWKEGGRLWRKGRRKKGTKKDGLDGRIVEKF